MNKNEIRKILRAYKERFIIEINKYSQEKSKENKALMEANKTLFDLKNKEAILGNKIYALEQKYPLEWTIRNKLRSKIDNMILDMEYGLLLAETGGDYPELDKLKNIDFDKLLNEK